MQIPHTKYEERLLSYGHKFIVGIDEVGRGSWAGPVVAAAYVYSFPKIKKIKGIRDSKLLTQKKREELFNRIIDAGLEFGIGEISVDIIDKIGILKATKKAMQEAVNNLDINPDYLLIDSVSLSNMKIPQKSINKGDVICYSISCASVVAKVTRDNMMINLSKLYPKYGFSEHKGYGTKKHQEALQNHGVTDIHRKSYRPIKKLL